MCTRNSLSAFQMDSFTCGLWDLTACSNRLLWTIREWILRFGSDSFVFQIARGLFQYFAHIRFRSCCTSRYFQLWCGATCAGHAQRESFYCSEGKPLSEICRFVPYVLTHLRHLKSKDRADSFIHALEAPPGQSILAHLIPLVDELETL